MAAVRKLTSAGVMSKAIALQAMLDIEAGEPLSLQARGDSPPDDVSAGTEGSHLREFHLSIKRAIRRSDSSAPQKDFPHFRLRQSFFFKSGSARKSSSA